MNQKDSLKIYIFLQKLCLYLCLHPIFILSFITLHLIYKSHQLLKHLIAIPTKTRRPISRDTPFLRLQWKSLNNCLLCNAKLQRWFARIIVPGNSGPLILFEWELALTVVRFWTKVLIKRYFGGVVAEVREEIFWGTDTDEFDVFHIIQ
jgi:hypothetical protein